MPLCRCLRILLLQSAATSLCSWVASLHEPDASSQPFSLRAALTHGAMLAQRALLAGTQGWHKLMTAACGPAGVCGSLPLVVAGVWGGAGSKSGVQI